MCIYIIIIIKLTISFLTAFDPVFIEDKIFPAQSIAVLR